MKNLAKSYWTAIVLIVLAVSCEQKKDDETLQQENHFKVGDNKYSLSKGLLYGYGQDGEDGNYFQGFGFELILTSSGISFIENEEGYIDGVGAGDAISLDLYSSSRTHLDEGDYTYSTQRPNSIGTFDWGSYIIGWKDSTDDSVEDSKIKSGKFNVKRNNNVYTITFDLTAENGKKVTGYYKGSLDFYDDSEPSSSERQLPYSKIERSKLLR